jgi:hypothetical protein
MGLSLFVTNLENEIDDLYRNNGDYNFTEVSYPSGLAFSALRWVKWGTAFADLENDGWLGLITAAHSEQRKHQLARSL